MITNNPINLDTSKAEDLVALKKDNRKSLEDVGKDFELIFAKNFTKKGGKFLYCENKNEVLQYFDEILIENNWTLSSITCKNDFLNSLKKISLAPT